MRISDWSSDVCSSDLQGPARVHPWGLRRAAAFRASGRARSSARYSGGIAPAQPDATVGRTSAFMQPPAGALTCAEPPMVRARRGHTMTEAHLFAIGVLLAWLARSEEHTSELQSLMRISYAVFCLKKKKQP